MEGKTLVHTLDIQIAVFVLHCDIRTLETDIFMKKKILAVVAVICLCVNSLTLNCSG